MMAAPNVPRVVSVPNLTCSSGFHLYRWVAPGIEGSHPLLPSLKNHFLSLLLLASSLGESEVLVDPGDGLAVTFIL